MNKKKQHRNADIQHIHRLRARPTNYRPDKFPKFIVTYKSSIWHFSWTQHSYRSNICHTHSFQSIFLVRPLFIGGFFFSLQSRHLFLLKAFSLWPFWKIRTETSKIVWKSWHTWNCAATTTIVSTVINGEWNGYDGRTTTNGSGDSGGRKKKMLKILVGVCRLIGTQNVSIHTFICSLLGRWVRCLCFICLFSPPRVLAILHPLSIPVIHTNIRA